MGSLASRWCHRKSRSRRCPRGSPGEPRVAGGNARRLSHGMAVSGAVSRGSIRGRRAAGVQQLCAGVRQGTHIASDAGFGAAVSVIVLVVVMVDVGMVDAALCPR